MRFALLTLVSVSLITTSLPGQSLPSGSVHYVVNYQGQPSGSASYTIEAGAGGYSVAARGNAKIGTIDLAYSKNETLDAKMEILSEALNGTINGQAVFVTVKPEGAKFQVDTSANGQQLSSTLDRHPHTVFSPNFDPSAIVLFLHHAASHKDLWALVPQQSGLLVAAQLTSEKDEKGTLDGSPIVVRHSTLVLANLTSQLFSTADGQLLQQEVPTQGFSMVRDGFLLTPPPAAAPPPPAVTPSAPTDTPPAAIR